MNTRALFLLTVVYVVTVFSITALWHVAIFQEQYLGLGYFKEKETFLAGVAGLLNIVVQGIVLSVLFSRTHFTGSNIVRGLKFAGLVGVFYFTLQVVNFVVRKEISDIYYFVALEAVYMLFQFTVYGILLGLVHGKVSARNS